MASRSDIKAGRAYVELYVKNSKLLRGLSDAGRRLQSFGMGIAKIGAIAAATGATIVTGLLSAVNHFVTVGDELDKFSARTGVAASAAAGLKFAARQSGAELDSVEKGLKGMARTLYDASQGMKSANDNLAALGLTVEDLQGLTPEEQFQKLGDGIKNISDPTTKAAVAMKIFGKSGADLIPMFDQLRAKMDEAARLELLPSDASTKAAAEFGDLFDKIKSVGAAAWFEIGASAAEALTPILKVVLDLAVSVTKWVKENRELVKTILAVGAGLIVAGGLITAIGLGIGGVGTVLTSIVAIVSAIASGIAFLLTPVGLVLAAVTAIGVVIAGLVVYWAMFTDSGKASVDALLSYFGELWDFVKEGFGGVVDALSAGDLELAMEIVVTGIKAIFYDLFADLETRFADMVESWGSVLLPLGLNEIAADALREQAAMVKDAAAGYQRRTAHLNAKAGILAGDKAANVGSHPADTEQWSSQVQTSPKILSQILGFNPNAVGNNAIGIARPEDKVAKGIDGLKDILEKVWQQNVKQTDVLRDLGVVSP